MADIINLAKEHVLDLLNHHLPPEYVYHSPAHTKMVVEKIEELIEGLKVSVEDAELLLLAAWFHDVGYIKTIEGHEEHSIASATSFLKKHEYPQEKIKRIAELIEATRMQHHPKNQLEAIIKDADCGHVSSKNYDEYASLLRKERELTLKQQKTDLEWTEENITFLTNKHQFYTQYATSNWEKRKGKNLAKLIKSHNKLTRDYDKIEAKLAANEIKKTKLELPERGVETMFRVALRNHIDLSNIADTKANILLSVNAIIISLVLSNLVSKLDNPSNDYLIVPTVVFTLFTVISIVLSIIATRPNVTEGTFTKEDVAKKKVNLIFFGNFHQMKLNDFEWALKEMMQDKDYLYGSLSKDLYFLGLVLNKKYKILRLTYTVFMTGIIISVLAFGLAFYLRGEGKPPIQDAVTTFNDLGSSIALLFC